MENSFRFPKSEKLCGKLRIKHLYDNGRHFTCYPLRVTYFMQPLAASDSPSAPSAPAALVWASKSLFKHAVVRNRLRRQMREAYRLHAATLRQFCLTNGIGLQVAFNYIAKEQIAYARIEEAMRKAVLKLAAAETYKK